MKVGGLMPEGNVSTNNKLKKKKNEKKKKKCVNRILPSDILTYVGCKCTVAVHSALYLC